MYYENLNKITWQNAVLEAAPRKSPPQDCTKTPHDPPVHHAQARSNMRNIPSLFMQEGYLILHVWLSLGILFQQGTSPHSSNQRGCAGPYCPKAHDQNKKNIVEATKATLILCQIS